MRAEELKRKGDDAAAAFNGLDGHPIGDRRNKVERLNRELVKVIEECNILKKRP
jgi:hypothetical protein